MTAAATPIFAANVFAWIMIVLPIVLLLGVGVAYLLGRRRSVADIERAEQASRSGAHGPSDPPGRPPSA